MPAPLIQLTSGNGLPPIVLINVAEPEALVLAGLRTVGSVMTATSNPFIISDPARSTSSVNLLPTTNWVPPKATGDVEHPVGAVAWAIAGSIQTVPMNCACAGVDTMEAAIIAAMRTKGTKIILFMITP